MKMVNRYSGQSTQTARRVDPWRGAPSLPRHHLKGGGKSRPHSGSPREGPRFAAGETVRETGIYEVIHDGDHRTAHEVVMLKGDTFPACDTCAQRVKFLLVRTAPYIFQDEDFGDPQ